MTDDEGFLDRWSRRKRAAREAARQPEPAPEPGQAPADEHVAALAVDGDEPAVDPADLPPLESIANRTDVQAFLRKGVPKALRQAALRRLWSVDPAIRDFREVADYDWDFNAPGYGALLPEDDPAAAADKLFAAMRRRVAGRDAASAEPAATQPAPTAPEPVDPALTEAPEPVDPAMTEAPEPVDPAMTEAEAVAASGSGPQPRALRPTPEGPARAPRRRRHGSAIPS